MTSRPCHLRPVAMLSIQSRARKDLSEPGAPATMTKLLASNMPSTSHFGGGMLSRSFKLKRRVDAMAPHQATQEKRGMLRRVAGQYTRARKKCQFDPTNLPS